MRRLRGWIFFGLIAAVTGTIWYRSRDVLMTEAEIRAAIPADLQFIPPTEQEAKTDQALWTLERDVFTDPNLSSPWIVGSFDTAWPDYWHVAANSDWVVDRVERLAKRGTPAAPLDLSREGIREEIPWQLYRVLSLRCDLKLAKNPRAEVRRDILALARFLRLAGLRRGSHGAQRFSSYSALQSINRALDAKAIDRKTARDLSRILPKDEEIVRVQQDQVRYDFESHVVDRLRPSQTYAILRPQLQSKDDYRQFVVGRLDVPATLSTQIAAAQGAIEMIATGKKDPRVSAAARARNELMSGLPWRKDGESTATQRFRELAYRTRLTFHPNPRGVANVQLGRLGFTPDVQERDDRAWFALTRARLQLLLGEKTPFPQDPYTGKPVRHDPKRRILWSIGGNRIDDDGTMPKQYIGLPDIVIRY